MFEEEKAIGCVVSIDGTPTFTEFRMLLNDGVDVCPGELVYTKSGNNYHVGRVSDAEWVDIYAEPAAVHLRSLLRIEERLPSAPGVPGRFRMAKVEVLEEVVEKNGTMSCLPSIRSLATPEAPVYRATEAIVRIALGLPPPDDSNIFSIGTLASLESEIDVPLPINRVLPRHILIVGTTGSGKTFARGILMEELCNHRIRQINFDIHGEYVKATEELGGVNLKPGVDVKVQLSSMTEMEVLRLLPLVHALHVDIVTRAFTILKNTGRSFGLTEFLREIENVGRDLGATPQTVSTVKFRARSLERERIIGAGTSWHSLLSKYPVVNLDCRELTHTEMHIIVGAVARELLMLRQRQPPEIPPVVLGVDEAHMFLPQGEDVPSSPILREVIRFGRHYGISLILVTPSPLDIDRRVVRTTNTRFIFAIEPDQLEALRGVFADAPEDLIRRLPKFEVGTCLLTGSRETIRHAVPIRIRSKRRTTHGGETPDFIAETRKFEAGATTP
jgi:DNA helicase HerA-like ATPase